MRALVASFVLWILLCLTLAPQSSLHWVEAINKMIEEELR